MAGKNKKRYEGSFRDWLNEGGNPPKKGGCVVVLIAAAAGVGAAASAVLAGVGALT